MTDDAPASTALAPFHDEVRAGAALLDRRGPANWRDLIDVEQLSIYDYHWCVVAQAFADIYPLDAYGRGLAALGLRDADDYEDDVVRYGFEAPHVHGEFSGRDYVGLTVAWLDYLHEYRTTTQN